MYRCGDFLGLQNHFSGVVGHMLFFDHPKPCCLIPVQTDGFAIQVATRLQEFHVLAWTNPDLLFLASLVQSKRTTTTKKQGFFLCETLNDWLGKKGKTQKQKIKKKKQKKTNLSRGRKGTPKNLCDKDFAKLSGELSGAICLTTLVLLRSALELFRKLFGAIRAIFGLWGSFLVLDLNNTLGLSVSALRASFWAISCPSVSLPSFASRSPCLSV